MLNTAQAILLDRPQTVQTVSPKGELSLSAVLHLLRRRRAVAFAPLIGVLVLAFAYVTLTPPSYTAYSRIMIDTGRVLGSRTEPVPIDPSADTAAVESQLETLRSDQVALAVVRRMRLHQDPEFVGGPPGLLRRAVNAVRGLIVPPRPAVTPTEANLQQIAAIRLKQRMTAVRIGRSHVIEVSFWSNDPVKAAAITNTITDRFIVDQIEARFNASQRTNTWLQERIEELRQQLDVADRAVQEFKAENNIIESNGKLMTDQELEELTRGLAQARATTAQTNAKRERILEVLKAEVPDAGVADVLSNPLIVRLRQQYLEAAKTEGEWSRRYGADHRAAINLRNEMEGLKRQIRGELERIAETYKSDLEIARNQEQSIQQRLHEVFERSAATRQAQVQLRQLESSAQSYRKIFEAMTQQFLQASQQASFPITESRVISPAVPPEKVSSPNSPLVMVLALFGGAGLAVMAAFARDHLDRIVRTSSQLERSLGVQCLGMLPRLTPDARIRTEHRQRVKAAQAGARDLPRPIRAHDPALSIAVAAPFSRYSETLRAAKVAADLTGDRSAHAIGVVSAVSGEGKSTVSANFAALLAQSGYRVLLIDGDLRNPNLTRQLASDAPLGLLDVLGNGASLSQVIYVDPVTGYHFLPGVVGKAPHHTSEILASGAMRRLIEVARQDYTYVIVDLPPMAPVVDVRATADLLDSFLLIVGWGKVSSDVLEKTLGDTPLVYNRLLGAVLNSVDMKAMRRFEGTISTYYSPQDYNYTQS